MRSYIKRLEIRLELVLIRRGGAIRARSLGRISRASLRGDS